MNCLSWAKLAAQPSGSFAMKLSFKCFETQRRPLVRACRINWVRDRTSYVINLNTLWKKAASSVANTAVSCPPAILWFLGWLLKPIKMLYFVLLLTFLKQTQRNRGGGLQLLLHVISAWCFSDGQFVRVSDWQSRILISSSHCTGLTEMITTKSQANWKRCHHNKFG